jgi:hypothetical protein
MRKTKIAGGRGGKENNKHKTMKESKAKQGAHRIGSRHGKNEETKEARGRNERKRRAVSAYPADDSGREKQVEKGKKEKTRRRK